jgi:hypothetical protein
MNTKLINFRTPENLQATFDMVCRYKSQSRTQVLIALMRDFVSTNHKPIINDIQSLQDLNKNLSEFVSQKPSRIINQKSKTMNSEQDIWEGVMPNYSDED